MEDLYFYDSPYGNPYVVPASTPQVVRDMWIQIMKEAGCSPAQSFTPTFEKATVVNSLDGTSMNLNSDYFATEETAVAIMKRFGADRIALVPYAGSGGPFSSESKERWVVWKDGTAINAGLLAALFQNSPENQFPHVAENSAWRSIAGARAAGQKLPENS